MTAQAYLAPLVLGTRVLTIGVVILGLHRATPHGDTAS